MIVEIHKKMELWAVWRENGCGHRLGFKESALSRLGGDRCASSDDADDYAFDRRAIEDCELIESLLTGVAGLNGFRCVSKSSARVLHDFYRTPGKPEQKAKLLGCCSKTLMRDGGWLHKAQADMGQCLEEARARITSKGRIVRQTGFVCHFADLADPANEKAY